MAIASAQPQLDSISKSIMNQMARAGQPKVTTTETETEIPDEGIDWGSMGLLLAMLLSGNTGSAPIMGADTMASYPGNAVQGVAGAPAATPSATPTTTGANPLAAIIGKLGGATGATTPATGTTGSGNDRNQWILNLWKEFARK